MYNFTDITDVIFTVRPYGNFESLATPVIESFEEICMSTFNNSPIKHKFTEEVKVDIDQHYGDATFTISTMDVDRVGRENIIELLNIIASAYYDFNETYRQFKEVL